MQVAQLIYRLYEDKDLTSVLNLWEKYSGWGGITNEQFYDWHIATPNGPCSIIVAETQEGEVVGQMVFRPTKMLLNGKKVNGYRVTAPILSDAFRESDLRSYDHPAFAMFRTGIEQVAKEKSEIIFVSPSVGWVAVVKTFPRYGLPEAQVSLFDCIGINHDQLNDSTLVEENDYGIRPGKISLEYEKLWNKFVKNYPVNNGVSRTAQWFTWRRGEELILETYDKETLELKGVIFIKKKTGQVVDIIGKNVEDLKQTLRLAAIWVHTQQGSEKIAELKLMYTPLAQQLVKEIPHHSINFRFAFACLSPKNEKIPPIQDWHIMPDD